LNLLTPVASPALLIGLALGSVIAFISLLVALLHYRSQFQEVKIQLEKKQTKSYEVGQNAAKGNYAHLLGAFGVLTEYQGIILLSTTSANGPLDLIGIKPDALDFIELKSIGCTLSSKERMVRRLVEEKRVNYRVYDVEIPQSTMIHERVMLTRGNTAHEQPHGILCEVATFQR
jgi:hypothetical protein